MPSWLLKGGVVVAAVIGGAWYLMQPGTYDECMLAEMRGQAQAMYSTVHKVCARRFGLEVPVDLPDGVAWLLTSEGKVLVTVRFDSEFRVTRASFMFSQKDCAVSSDKDFSRPTPQIARGLSFEFYLPTEVSKPVCMRWRDIKGRYR